MIQRLPLLVPVALALAVALPRAQSPAEPLRSGFGAGAYPAGFTTVNLLRVVDPAYPEAALQARLEGQVLMDAVVGADGRVKDVRVTQSLDVPLGLDAAAVAAVRRWRFSAPTFSGRPVSAVVPVRVVFYLHRAGTAAGAPFTESGLLPGPDPTADADAVKTGTPGLIEPMLRRQVAPAYTPEAMRRKIQGVVEIDVIIDTKGRVTSPRVTRSLDRVYGLDERALMAISRWQFSPGRLNGVAVPVAVRLVLEFGLH